jgi:hypothetical protein
LDPADRLDRVTLVVIEPGHHAWTVGDDACVLLDTGGASNTTLSRPAALAV